MRLRPHVFVVPLAVLGGLCTIAVAAIPSLSFAYKQPGLHIMLESVSGLIAILAALLLFGRLTVAPRLDLLLLGTALLLFGVTNLGVTAIPDALRPNGGHTVASWGALLCRLIGDLILLAAAFVRQRRLRRPLGALVLAVGGVGLLAVGAVSAALLSRSTLPPAVSLESTAPNHLDIDGHYLVVTAQLVGLLAYVSATIVFTRRAARQDDAFLGWLSLAMTFGALARLNYSANPSLYSPWFYTGDGFRLLGYLMLLVAAFSEIGRYWHRLADAAAAEERRRIARDLHDGVAQELAYILREGKRINLPDELISAAKRGLAESRRGLFALEPPSDESLEQALLHATQDVAARDGVRLEFDVGNRIEVTWQVREALARITREAVNNASRHGRARLVRIAVSNGNGIALVVRDDGVGFDLGRYGGRGYGLRTMRERAESLGGGLFIRSLPGRGTQVEVVLP